MIGKTYILIPAIVALTVMMVVGGQQIVQADHGYGPGCDTGYHWNPDTGNCVENAYIQHSHITLVSGTGHCPCGNGEGFWTCKVCPGEGDN